MEPIASPVPVRAAPPRPPDDKQPCIEDFFLSSARVPMLLPARSVSWDAERFNDAQGGEAELSDEVVRADVHWSAPTALDEPGFISVWEDSGYVDGASAHADDYGHGMHSDAQLGAYDEGISGTYGHVYDPACEPSAVYHEADGYSDGNYGADDCSTASGCDGGTSGGYDWNGYNGGYDDGGGDGDYGGDY